MDAARGWREQSGDEVEERGLSGAVRTENHASLTDLHRERHTVQCTKAAELVREPVHRERAHEARAPRCRVSKPRSPAGAKSVTAM